MRVQSVKIAKCYFWHIFRCFFSMLPQSLQEENLSYCYSSSVLLMEKNTGGLQCRKALSPWSCGDFMGGTTWRLPPHPTLGAGSSPLSWKILNSLIFGLSLLSWAALCLWVIFFLFSFVFPRGKHAALQMEHPSEWSSLHLGKWWNNLWNKDLTLGLPQARWEPDAESDIASFALNQGMNNIHSPNGIISKEKCYKKWV